MSSPAEILAQKHAQAAIPAETESAPVSEPVSVPSTATTILTIDESSVVKPAETPATPVEEESKPEPVAEDAPEPAKPAKKNVSINDEKLFPALGAGASTAPLSWVKPVNGAKTNGSKVKSPTASFKPAVKSTSTQFTFIIDADQQVNLSKADVFKIFSKIKSAYGVSIESTFSSATNKRTFLLNGPISSIYKAKRDVVKQLTKPVKIEFGIPSKLRSAVIGSQGKTLKPILESTGTRIDIARPGDVSTAGSTPSPELAEEEELFGQLINVTIEGDIEGCEDAKAKILAIVNENTKSLSVRVPVSDKLKPFVASEIESLSLPSEVEVTSPIASSKASNILLSGPRESIIDSRNKIKELLVSLDGKIIVDEKTVPKAIHQFLDAEKIFEKTNVVVVTPPADSTNATVKFIGKKENISSAITYGKELASEYVTDSLDLARSHGGNYLHAKSITSFFVYSKFLDQLATKYGVKINAPSYQSLANDEIKSDVIQFICAKDDKDTLKAVRKEIVESVNKITPSFVKVITDIESFVFSKLDKTVAIEKNVAIVPLGDLAGFSNKLILIVQQDDEDFLPSAEEINEKLEAVNKSLDPLRDLSKNVASEVIAVPSADQAHLEGQTLKLLLSKFDLNSIEIKLHQNAEGLSADDVYLIGYKSDISKAIKDIEQAIEDVKNYEIASKYNINVDFPTKFLSRLIGQKGANMNQLRDDYDVKIDVLDDAEAKEGNTAVKLTGLKTNVDEAQKKLHQLSKKWLDEKIVVMKIEQKFHRKMIGPNGVYVNRLQDKYNVVVKFPFENSQGNKDEVTIRGPSKGVHKVEEELKELLQYEKENGFKESIKVPVDVLPQVIGKAGEHIKDISADAGVEINQNRDGDEKKDGFAEFAIIGSKTGIKSAIAKISAIVDRAQNYVNATVEVDPKFHKNLIGPGGLTKREIIIKAGGADVNGNEFRRLLQVPNKGSESKDVVCSGDKRIVDKIVEEIKKIVGDLESITTETIEVPKKKHRLIIGPAGSVRRGIEEEFKVRLNIPKVGVESDSIRIHGSPENIEKAKAKLLTLTD